MQKIFLRPLEVSDALVSWRWRNDAAIWKYTGSRPDIEITEEIETQWIHKVLARDNERRYAICLEETGEYIGNVQLTSITDWDAEFHIFIGEKRYWGTGCGSQATSQIVSIALGEMKLNNVYLHVKQENVAAVKAYKKAGFNETVVEDGNVRMITFGTGKAPKLSVFVMTYNHGKFIHETMQGILNQQCDFDYDVVVGDDFSTDDTRDILLSYARNNPKVKLILHEKNRGPHVNQVAIFNNCKGEHIAICEGDDYWTQPLKLQQQVDFLDANPEFSLTFHKAAVYDENTKSFPDDSSFYKETKDVSDLADIVKGNYIRTPTVVMRNNIDYPEWFQYSFPSDWALFILSAMKGKIKFFDQTMAVYRIHVGGTYSMVKSSFKKEEKTFNDIYEELKKNGFDEIAQWVKQRNDFAYVCEYGLKRNTSRLKQASVILSKGSLKLKLLFWVPLLFKNSEAAFKKILKTNDL
jgi:glycosyltransferase involved in cell wall biosynthesis/RimJ/RimL family protein N-acetyltransferase